MAPAAECLGENGHAQANCVMPMTILSGSRQTEHETWCTSDGNGAVPVLPSGRRHVHRHNGSSDNRRSRHLQVLPRLCGYWEAPVSALRLHVMQLSDRGTTTSLQAAEGRAGQPQPFARDGAGDAAADRVGQPVRCGGHPTAPSSIYAHAPTLPCSDCRRRPRPTRGRESGSRACRIRHLVAGNGREALEALSRHRPGVILSRNDEEDSARRLRDDQRVFGEKVRAVLPAIRPPRSVRLVSVTPRPCPQAPLVASQLASPAGSHLSPPQDQNPSTEL